MSANEFIFGKVLSFKPQIYQKMNFLAGIFQSFWYQGKKSYFAEQLAVIASVLLLFKSIFSLLLKHNSRWILPKGVNLPRAKYSAMFVLIATATLC